jgi:hypothetical protein
MISLSTFQNVVARVSIKLYFAGSAASFNSFRRKIASIARIVRVIWSFSREVQVHPQRQALWAWRTASLREGRSWPAEILAQLGFWATTCMGRSPSEKVSFERRICDG